MGCGASRHMDKEIINVVKTTFTPTGDFKKDELRARGYAKAVGMDQANTEIAVVMATQGFDAGANAMIKKHTTDGKFDYFAMRQQYG
uniref:Uncharacterized protein n=1 Tax=viral metagenome TaxID=1070528 RepID=A0A6C0B0E8_9ZZZZ